jgi:ketosteroid isomerase-like protein
VLSKKEADMAVLREYVQEFYAALNSRNPLRIAPFLADDVDWFIMGPIDIFPFCRRTLGKPAVLELFGCLIPDMFDVKPYEHDYLLVDNNCAAAFSRLICTQRTTGRVISYRIAHFMRFRDAKVAEFRSIIDTLDAAEQVLGRSLTGSQADGESAALAALIR